MSQPHPPIPEPQPHPEPTPHDAEMDEPRTQSILLPPSQRQGNQFEEPAPQPVEPAAAEPASPEPPAPDQPLPGQPGPAPTTGQFARPPDQPAYQPVHPQPYEPGPPTQSTGPMDFVPGFSNDRPPLSPSGSTAATAPPRSPGPSTTPGGSPGTPPATARRSPLAAVQRAGRGGTAAVSVGLAVLALVLLQLGLARNYGNQSLWAVVPTWSAFATLAAVVVLAGAVVGLTGRLPARTAWRAAAAGTAALATAWVLVALPLAASERGFWLTAAVAAAGAALWLAPGRTE